MSVIPMQKVRCVVHQDDADRLLGLLQQAGAVEFTETTLPDTDEVQLRAPHSALFPRVQHAVTFLSAYQKKPSLWRMLRDGTFVELTEADVRSRLADTDAVTAVVEDMERLQVEIAEYTEKVRTLEEELAVLQRFADLPFRLADCRTMRTETVLLERALPAHTATTAALGDELTAEFTARAIPHAITQLGPQRVALTTLTAACTPQDREAVLETVDATEVALPAGAETPAVEATAVAERLAKAKGELGIRYDQAEHAATIHLSMLKTAAEILRWEHDRYAAVAQGCATAHTVVLDGWLDAEKGAQVARAIAKEQLAAVLQPHEPAPDEEPPVEIRNPRLIQPFEVVTRLYGMPGYRDLDPTLFLAGFFFLFFGLSLTDVGYGLFLMTAAVIILTLFTVAPVVRTFAKLLFLMGLGSFLVGLLFGGYLGIAPESLPPALRAIQLFDPIGNPLPVFYLALGLGVFQVMVGMLLKIYSEARQGRLLSGLMDQGPWLFVFCVAIAYVAVVTGYLSAVTTTQLTNLLYLGIALIIVASGRHGKTLLEKVQKSALSLYDSIGYFSDILSYSRLLALGLATTALAFAVNLIAEIVSDSVPYLGPVLAIVVLVIGHLFTLAVNTLGAFIHSARLQFVEFFGKFITGTGREFKPLRRSHQYVLVKDE